MDINISVFCVGAPCSLAEVQIEVANASEMSANVYKTTTHEDCSLQTRYRGNLKSHTKDAPGNTVDVTRLLQWILRTILTSATLLPPTPKCARSYETSIHISSSTMLKCTIWLYWNFIRFWNLVSLPRRTTQRLEVFEKREMKREFGPKREKVQQNAGETFAVKHFMVCTLHDITLTKWRKMR